MVGGVDWWDSICGEDVIVDASGSGIGGMEPNNICNHQLIAVIVIAHAKFWGYVRCDPSYPILDKV